MHKERINIMQSHHKEYLINIAKKILARLPLRLRTLIILIGWQNTLKYFFFQRILRINGHVPWPVHWSSRVMSPDKIIQENIYPGFSMNSHIDGRNGIILGKNVRMGPRVSIISMNHKLDDYVCYEEEGPIVIGDNCWLGTNVIILPGIKLGNHVVVGAGAVVTKSFEEDDILIAGVPAKIIKKLGPYRGRLADCYG
jgi:acetyltransferase-like isoleucine patch superfamily enzyme